MKTAGETGATSRVRRILREPILMIALVLALGAGLVLAPGPVARAGFFDDVLDSAKDAAKDTTDYIEKKVGGEANEGVDDVFEGDQAQPPSAQPQATQPPSAAPTQAPVSQPSAAPSAAQSTMDPTSEVQSRLNNLGYNAGPVDGQTGIKTAMAIAAFQKDHGMAQDGKITPALIEALRAADGAGTGPGQQAAQATANGAEPSRLNIEGATLGMTETEVVRAMADSGFQPLRHSARVFIKPGSKQPDISVNYTNEDGVKRARKITQTIRQGGGAEVKTDDLLKGMEQTFGKADCVATGSKPNTLCTWIRPWQERAEKLEWQVGANAIFLGLTSTTRPSSSTPPIASQTPNVSANGSTSSPPSPGQAVAATDAVKNSAGNDGSNAAVTPSPEQQVASDQLTAQANTGASAAETVPFEIEGASLGMVTARVEDAMRSAGYVLDHTNGWYPVENGEGATSLYKSQTADGNEPRSIEFSYIRAAGAADTTAHVVAIMFISLVDASHLGKREAFLKGLIAKYGEADECHAMGDGTLSGKNLLSAHCKWTRKVNGQLEQLDWDSGIGMSVRLTSTP